MATFERAVTEWTDTINDWYNLDARTDEVKLAFNELKAYHDDLSQLMDLPNGTSYVESFFHGPGKLPGGGPIWCTMLDTEDREHLADLVQALRKQQAGM
jgi:hypothetical protein